MTMGPVVPERKARQTVGISNKRLQSEAERISAAHAGRQGVTIAVLQSLQETFGYVPEEAVGLVAERLGVPESRFFGAATFYSQFYLNPRGKKIVTACSGTACHVRGSEALINSLNRELGLKGGEDTTPDGEITVEKVACLGTCSMAPVFVFNKKMHGKMNMTKLKRELRALKKGHRPT